MPAAPSYDWEETESHVTIKVCRRGLPRGNHDMLSTGQHVGRQLSLALLHRVKTGWL
jgi:hypothetical protein